MEVLSYPPPSTPDLLNRISISRGAPRRVSAHSPGGLFAESGKSISSYTFWPPGPFLPGSLLFLTLPCLSEREREKGLEERKKEAREGGRKCVLTIPWVLMPSLIYSNIFKKCQI